MAPSGDAPAGGGAEGTPDAGRGDSALRDADPTLPPDDLASEALLVVLRGIGASMFLTDRHLILARDGAERRPRTGVQPVDLHDIRHIAIELGQAPSGRIVVRAADDQELLSMFFDARSLDRAHDLVDVARPLIARSRRARRDAAQPRRRRRSSTGRRPSPDPRSRPDE